MKTALVIEDDQNNMVLITSILEKHGYRTLRATTGQEGYERALAELPDFIILDIQLPDMDGTEVLKRLRNVEVSRRIAVVAMTSYAMAGDRERLMQAGCDGYIEKPIIPSAVVAQIRELIGDVP